MTLRGVGAAVLASALLVGLVGCGEDSEEAYCKAVKSEQEKFAEMQSDVSGLGLLEGLPTLRRLSAKAPDDLRDEWQTFLGALDAFSETLDEVGVEPTDFVDGKPPVGLSAAERTRIADAANELSSPDVVDAADGIEQQAKDVCKLQLGL